MSFLFVFRICNVNHFVNYLNTIFITSLFYRVRAAAGIRGNIPRVTW